MCDSDLDRDFSNNLEKEDNNLCSLKIYESFKNEEEYRQSNYLSYSKIKDVYDNPLNLITERKQEDKEWLTFGTLVDLLLTDPKEFYSNVIINNKVPSGKYAKILEYLIDNKLEDLDNLTNEQVEAAYTYSESQVNWKIETKKTNLITECKDYILFLIANKDKLIVNTELYNEAVKVAHILKTHRWTKKYLDIDSKDKNTEILFQYKIKYIFEGLNFKSKFDVLLIDHDLKIIFPIDIKTGSDLPRYFIKYGLYKYKYGYQGALYKEGLRIFLRKLPQYHDYDIAPFRFIYISRLVPTYPIILTMSATCHKEFLEFGINNEQYFIPSLLELTEAIDSYYTQINEGKTSIEPFDLQDTQGEIMAKNVTNNLVF